MYTDTDTDIDIDTDVERTKRERDIYTRDTDTDLVQEGVKADASLVSSARLLGLAGSIERHAKIDVHVGACRCHLQRTTVGSNGVI